MKQTTQIKTIKQLKTLAHQENGGDIFIVLNGGVRSSKHIRWVNHLNKFFILNYIDDSQQYLTEKQLNLKKHTLIGEALNKGALYATIY